MCLGSHASLDLVAARRRFHSNGLESPTVQSSRAGLVVHTESDVEHRAEQDTGPEVSAVHENLVLDAVIAPVNLLLEFLG